MPHGRESYSNKYLYLNYIYEVFGTRNKVKSYRKPKFLQKVVTV